MKLFSRWWRYVHSELDWITSLMLCGLMIYLIAAHKLD